MREKGKRGLVDNHELVIFEILGPALSNLNTQITYTLPLVVYFRFKIS